MFEYQIEYMNGNKTEWILWDRLDLALEEAELTCVTEGSDKIKGLVFRRVGEEKLFRFRPDKVMHVVKESKLASKLKPGWFRSNKEVFAVKNK